MTGGLAAKADLAELRGELRKDMAALKRPPFAVFPWNGL